jgi:hypothetical protein
MAKFGLRLNDDERPARVAKRRQVFAHLVDDAHGPKNSKWP